MLEVHVVHVDHQDLALGVRGNPGLVALVEPVEVIEPDALLVLTAALLDLFHKVAHATAEVDEQVRRRHELLHQLEKAEEVLVVA